MSTRDTILSLLRRETLTINELADRIGVARNAVVLPLQQLEMEGLVQGTPRRVKRAGKPSLEYAVLPGHEDATSHAYKPFVELLMETLPAHLPSEQLNELMADVGRKMAREIPSDETSGFAKRLDLATDFVDELGAETSIEHRQNQTIVRSFSCPLARAVRRHTCVCQAVASFFSAATGVEVNQECEYENRLNCKFVFATSG